MASRGRKVPWRRGGTAQSDTGNSGPIAPPSQSRFVEGSMNDRASAAPPLDFLGPNDVAAYERQFYDAEERLRPFSSAGQYQNYGYPQPSQWPHKPGPPSRKGNKIKFWDGVKEKLHLTRSQSWANIGAGIGKENRLLLAQTRTPHETNAPPVGYPTREEVMESYKSLAASGFFESHAIHGTRHPLRQTVSNDGRPSTEMGPRTRPLLPPIDFTKPTFAQHMAARQQHSSGFPAVPYSSTRRPHPSEPPSVLPQRPPLLARADEIISPSRGTKRAAAPDSDAPFSTETGARKLVKKLRRSASRISTDLSGPPPSMLNNINPFKPRPSTSSNAPTVTSIMSSLTAASSGTRASPPPPISQRTPTKLTKAKQHPRRGRVLGLGGINIARRRSRSRSRPRTPRREAGPSPLAMNPVTTTVPVLSIPLVDDAMLLDSPERSPARMSMERPITALAPPPSFHYPARKRGQAVEGITQPLSVVPDPNRGIPGVPRIPVEFCEGAVFGKPSSPKAGSRDSGLGDDEDMENVVRVW